MSRKLETIRAGFADPDVHVRRAAAEDAGRLGWEAAEVVPELLRALQDEDKHVVRKAVVALGKVNPPPKEAVAPLMAAIRGREPDDLTLQQLAAWAVGRMGRVAGEALELLEEQSTRPDRPDWPSERTEEVRKASATAADRIRNAFDRQRPRTPFVTEPSRKITVIREVDVAVIGSGPAGLIAAAAAVRAGARTLLIEKEHTVFPAVVYSGTAGIFNAFRTLTPAEKSFRPRDGHLRDHKERESSLRKAIAEEGQVLQCIAGLPWEFIKHLVALDGFAMFKSELEALCGFRLQVNPEVAQYGAITFLEKRGVETLVASPACAPIMEDGRVTGVFVENKSGRRAVLARAVVDASGESDIATQAGAPTYLGRDAGAPNGSLLWVIENWPHEPNLPYRSGQDSANAPDPEVVQKLAAEHGFDAERFLDSRNWIGYRRRGHGCFVGGFVDGGDGEDNSMAELETRKYAFELIRFCREHVPGFENVVLRQISPQILWRGVRCIVGDYYLTPEDVAGNRRFDDAVYLYRNPREEKPGACLQIPYRMLLPKNVEGILVAGKCASGASSVRGTVSCMCMGQAAGVAAAIAAREGTTPRQIDVQELQDNLRQQGVILDEPRRVALALEGQHDKFTDSV